MTSPQRRARLRDRDRHHSWREVYDELDVDPDAHETGVVHASD